MTDAAPDYLQRGKYLSLPADWSEIRLIAALSSYPSARHLARRLGVMADDLSCDLSRRLARALLEGEAFSEWVAESLHHHDADCPVSWKGALAICKKLDDGTATEAGALAAVEMIAHDQARKRLAEQFKWAAGELERDNPTQGKEMNLTAQAAACLRRITP